MDEVNASIDKKQLKKLDWEKIHKDYYLDKKLSLKKISKILKCSKTSVNNYFKKNNLVKRTVAETREFINIDFDRHPNWKGGLILDKIHNRYMRCTGNGTYIQESIFVYLKHNNLEEMPENYVIHHIDFDKTNNNINNLQLMSRSEHTTLHNTIKGD